MKAQSAFICPNAAWCVASLSANLRFDPDAYDDSKKFTTTAFRGDPLRRLLGLCEPLRRRLGLFRESI
jgi:hypothetical protein